MGSLCRKEETRLADLLGYGRLALVVLGKEREGLCGYSEPDTCVVIVSC